MFVLGVANQPQVRKECQTVNNRALQSENGLQGGDLLEVGQLVFINDDMIRNVEEPARLWPSSRIQDGNR